METLNVYFIYMFPFRRLEQPVQNHSSSTSQPHRGVTYKSDRQRVGRPCLYNPPQRTSKVRCGGLVFFLFLFFLYASDICFQCTSGTDWSMPRVMLLISAPLSSTIVGVIVPELVKVTVSPLGSILVSCKSCTYNAINA